MGQSELTKIATEYMQIWSAGNEDKLDQFADEKIVADYTHLEKPYKGISDYKSMLKMTYNFFPDLKILLKRVVPNENEGNVTIVWKYEGTHKNGNLFGVESSGKKVSVDGMTILKIDKELVTKENGIVDNLSLIMQIGALKTG